MRRIDALVPRRRRERYLMISSALMTSLFLSLMFTIHFSVASESSETSSKTPSEHMLAVSSSLNLSELKQRELAQIFSGRRGTWPNSHIPVQLILLPEGSSEMQWLCKQLKMPEHLVRRFIYRRVYQGTMRTPLTVNTTDEAIKTLQMISGAIAPLILTDRHKKQLTSGGELEGAIRLVTIVP